MVCARFGEETQKSGEKQKQKKRNFITLMLCIQSKKEIIAICKIK